ncbi:ATPase RavA stimulator ViaA [Vibrio albus]|uniref:ATPase RavA stimulator ViaA n=1 Tax=Vibrio albus TaxID=2200953 RepID=A0A2U3B570_9VIBR|nr:ATPase RavA stimulator ViaA [Vibrio albus]PWI31953.1 ATPase RavA stimulator ViaA [Vibrio albus]
MLGMDELNIAMMVAESGIVETAIDDLMEKVQFLAVAESARSNELAKEHIHQWSHYAQKRVADTFENSHLQNELTLYRETLKLNERHFYSRLPSLLGKLASTSSFYPEAKKLIEQNRAVKNPLFAQHFCDCWYESLLNSVKETESGTLDSEKEKCLADLRQRLESLEYVNEIAGTGQVGNFIRAWDMAASKLTKGDITAIRKHANFLRKNSELKEIANQLGRMASQVDDPELRKNQQEELKIVEEVSDEATDDIVGVHQHNDLNRMLPNEAIFLAYPELETIFYKRFLTKRLMNYKMRGKARKLKKVRAEKAENQTADIEKGPFILCVDASGSMRGFPEECAKGMAYALMQVALEEDRDCYVILFSTEQITYELTGQDGLREAGVFLSYQFRGGTELEPALIKSVELMSEEKYKNADLVVLSDFIAPKQPEAIQQMVASLQKQQNRFHAVCFSKHGNPQLMDMFDHCWDYHPGMWGRLMKKW